MNKKFLEQIKLGNYFLFYKFVKNDKVKTINEAIELIKNFKVDFDEKIDFEIDNEDLYFFKEYFEGLVLGNAIGHKDGKESEEWKIRRWEEHGGKLIYQKMGYLEDQKLISNILFWDFGKLIFEDFEEEEINLLENVFINKDWEYGIELIQKLYRYRNKAFYKKFQVFIGELINYYSGAYRKEFSLNKILKSFLVEVISNGIEISSFFTSIKLFIDAILYYYQNNGSLSVKIISYLFISTGLSTYFISKNYEKTDFFENISEEIKK